LRLPYVCTLCTFYTRFTAVVTFVRRLLPRYYVVALRYVTRCDVYAYVDYVTRLLHCYRYVTPRYRCCRVVTLCCDYLVVVYAFALVFVYVMFTLAFCVRVAGLFPRVVAVALVVVRCTLRYPLRVTFVGTFALLFVVRLRYVTVAGVGCCLIAFTRLYLPLPRCRVYALFTIYVTFVVTLRCTLLLFYVYVAHAFTMLRCVTRCRVAVVTLRTFCYDLRLRCCVYPRSVDYALR